MVHLYNLSCARCTQRSLAWRWIHCKLWPLLPWQSREKCMAPGGAGGPSATAEPRICTAPFLLLFWLKELKVLKVLKVLKKYKCFYELKNEVNMRWEGYSSELRDLFLSFGMRDELLAFELWQYSAFCSLQGGWLLARYQSPTLLSMPCDLCVFASLWCPYAYTEAVSSNRRGSTRFSSSKLLLGQSLPVAENGGFFLKWVPGTTVDTIFDPFFIGFSINNPVFDWHLPILQLRHWIHIHDLINRLGVGMGVTILDTQWMNVNDRCFFRQEPSLKYDSECAQFLYRLSSPSHIC